MHVCVYVLAKLASLRTPMDRHTHVHTILRLAARLELDVRFMVTQPHLRTESVGSVGESRERVRAETRD